MADLLPLIQSTGITLTAGQNYSFNQLFTINGQLSPSVTYSTVLVGPQYVRPAESAVSFHFTLLGPALAHGNWGSQYVTNPFDASAVGYLSYQYTIAGSNFSSSPTAPQFMADGTGITVAANYSGDIKIYLGQNSRVNTSPYNVSTEANFTFHVGVPLFSDTQNSVNFNALTSDQAELLLNGVSRYNAMDGDDVVSLPDQSTVVPGGYAESNTFYAGSGNDTITGGTRSDRINGGANNDTFIGSIGSDVIDGGADNDTFDFTTISPSIFPLGTTTQRLDGSEGEDRINLAGGRSSYRIETSLGAAGSEPVTTITYFDSVAGRAVTLETTEIEFAHFQGNFTNVVSPTHNAASAEAIELALDAYNLGSFAASSRGWRPLTAIEVGIDARGVAGNTAYTFDDGIYRAENITGIIGYGVLNNQRTLFLSFTGTDSVSDVLSYDFHSAYSLYRPIFNAIETFVGEAHIAQILVSGHSLGAGFVELFSREFGASLGGALVAAYTIAPPGALGTESGANLLNIVHNDDPVRSTPYSVTGDTVVIDPLTTGGHRSANYDATFEQLLQHSRDDDSLFYNDPIAVDLRGSFNHRSTNRDVSIELGTDSSNVITITGSEHYVLAGAGNDTINLLRTAGAPHLVQQIDGGAGNVDVLNISDPAPLSSSTYRLEQIGPNLLLRYTGADPHIVAELHNVETINVNGTLLTITTLTGGPSTPAVPGTPSSDRLIPNGNQRVDGGDGIDAAIFNKPVTDYIVQSLNGETHVLSANTYDVTVNVERLFFSDSILAFDINGNAGDVYRLYQAAFDRTPDTAGLSAWVRALDLGAEFNAIAIGFQNAPEFTQVYGANSTNRHFVELLYQNVLGRQGEESGIAAWVNALDLGASRAGVLIGFSESNENHANVDPAIMNGIMLEMGVFA